MTRFAGTIDREAVKPPRSHCFHLELLLLLFSQCLVGGCGADAHSSSAASGGAGSSGAGSGGVGASANLGGATASGGSGVAGGAAGASGSAASGGALAGSGGSSGGAGGMGGAAGSAAQGLVWPNDQSSANSDPWILEHHDQITKMRPRVLVLDAFNKRTLAEARTAANKLAFSLDEGSRYHGYKDPTAPAFLDYQIEKIADLTDKSGKIMALSWPVTAQGDFDYGGIFTQAFANLIGIPDPKNPQRSLTLCELFEQGRINEVWTVGDGPVVFESKARSQVYDDQLQPIPGKFSNCGGNGCFDPGPSGQCAVTVRLVQLNTERGPGCDTHGAGHGMESMRGTIPYYSKNATRFFRFDMQADYGVSFGSMYDCTFSFDGNPKCAHFLSPTHVINEAGLPTFDIQNWGIGCGNVHFAPNSTFHYDYENDNGVTAANSCENYGLGNGEKGADALSDYTYETVRKLNEDPRFSDCGGGWQIYMRQSFPGYHNQAKDVNGAPMKNWWPFLFY